MPDATNLTGVHRACRQFSSAGVLDYGQCNAVGKGLGATIPEAAGRGVAGGSRSTVSTAMVQVVVVLPSASVSERLTAL